jgi:PAP2 superfamily
LNCICSNTSRKILKILICTVLLFFLQTVKGNAKPANVYNSSDDCSSIFSNLWCDLKSIISSNDFYGVIGLLSISPEIMESSFKNEHASLNKLWAKSIFADSFFEYGDRMGSTTYNIIPSLLCFGIGSIGDLSKMEELGSHLLRAHAVNGIITSTMKLSFNRTRPSGGPYSYPSGHTSTAFTSAGVIYYDLGPKYGIPALVAATYVGFSRLQENKHYLSDIIAGAILGTYIGYKVTHRDELSRNLKFKPLAYDGAFGASISISF